MMKLTTFGLIVFMGTVVASIPDSYGSNYRKSYTPYTTPAPTYQKSYSEGYKYSAPPKVVWGYWANEGLLNQNQEHQRTQFEAVDCELIKKIVYYDWKNINFGEDYVFEWTDESEAEGFLREFSEVKKRCYDVQVLIDPEFFWNQEIADQITKNKVSVSQVARSLTDFNIKYYTNGMVVSFEPGVVLNDKLTFEFFKELKRLFTQNNLKLVFSYGVYNDLSYVRPVAFEFADQIFIYTNSLDTKNRNTLEHSSPAFSNDLKSASAIIDAFLNMGAQRSQLNLSVGPFGFSFKRVKCTSETDIGCPAAGAGTIIYPGNTIIVEGKNVFPSYHDLPNVCRVINNPEWTKKYDDVAQVPYAFNDEQWIGYEDERSIKVKANIVKETGIAGVHVFLLNSDDIYNQCGNGEYSFSKAFINELAYSY